MMLKAIGKNTKTVYLVLGFVGGEDGPARAIVVDPVKGGRASVAHLHDLEFEPIPQPPLVAPTQPKPLTTKPGEFNMHAWDKKKK